MCLILVFTVQCLLSLTILSAYTLDIRDPPLDVGLLGLIIGGCSHTVDCWLCEYWPNLCRLVIGKTKST